MDPMSRYSGVTFFRKTPFTVCGTDRAAVIRELEPVEGEYIIRKIKMSAFMQTELDSVLRTLCVDTVFVSGIQTPNCIRTRAFDVFALNYQVFLIEDAVAAQSEEIHQSNCSDMASIGVGMVQVADLDRLICV
jgi:nicotinamidase-related amidase